MREKFTHPRMYTALHHIMRVGPGFSEESYLSYNTLHYVTHTHTHTHTRLTAPFPGLPRWAGTRKVKPIWILLKQDTVSGSGISWDICKSAPHSRQITTPAPHRWVFYRPDALPATQPTASKHWRQTLLYVTGGKWPCRQFIITVVHNQS